MLEMMEGPAGPPPLLLPVQLLQRISPWLPFFHMDEEFVLHTAQHGFNPSGIVGGCRSQVLNNEALVAGKRPPTKQINPDANEQMQYLGFSDEWRHLRETISGNTSAPSDPGRIASCVIYCDRHTAAIAGARVSFSTLLVSVKFEKGATTGQDELLTWHFRHLLLQLFR